MAEMSPEELRNEALHAISQLRERIENEPLKMFSVDSDLLTEGVHRLALAFEFPRIADKAEESP